jgi:hypothetical protein
MPYSCGQRPQIGDRAKKKDDGSFATVIGIELDRPGFGQDRIMVKWDSDENSFTDQAEVWVLIARG